MAGLFFGNTEIVVKYSFEEVKKLENKQISISTEYITLGQLLKMTDIIQTGGMAKHFLIENQVFVNGERETRRGRKLYVGDQVMIDGFGEFIIA